MSGITGLTGGVPAARDDSATDKRRKRERACIANIHIPPASGGSAQTSGGRTEWGSGGTGSMIEAQQDRAKAYQEAVAKCRA